MAVPHNGQIHLNEVRPHSEQRDLAVISSPKVIQSHLASVTLQKRNFLAGIAFHSFLLLGQLYYQTAEVRSVLSLQHLFIGLGKPLVGDRVDKQAAVRRYIFKSGEAFQSQKPSQPLDLIKLTLAFREGKHL